MCHFVTAVLPVSADHGELDAIARKHGRQFHPLTNASIAAQIAPDERYFLTTTGHCDCGTPLGALARGLRRKAAPDWEARALRLRRKGWSPAKIARAVEQKRADFDNAAKLMKSEDVRPKLVWLDFIRVVLESGKTTHLGLLVHMYDGALANPIVLAGRETVAASALTSDVLGHMQDDVLYVFRP